MHRHPKPMETLHSIYYTRENVGFPFNSEKCQPSVPEFPNRKQETLEEAGANKTWLSPIPN